MLHAIRHRQRSEGHFGPSHAEGFGAIRRQAHERGLRVIIAGAGGAAALAGRDGGIHHPARHRCAHRKQIAQGPRLTALHRANAAGRAGRNRRDCAAKNAGLLAVQILAVGDARLQKAAGGIQTQARRGFAREKSKP